MNDTLKAALIGGLILGVASGIPFVNWGNILCCGWVLAGGILGVLFYNKFTNTKAEHGKGALIGLFAGLIGAPIAAVLNTLFAAVMRTAMTNVFSNFIQMTGTEAPAMMPVQSGVTLLSFVITLISNLIVFSVFGTLGGLLGSVILKKK